MKKWTVIITDGDGINHIWYIYAKNKFDALCEILTSWDYEEYGMPYGIEKSGIKKVMVCAYGEENR